jgi:hypothetical protein
MSKLKEMLAESLWINALSADERRRVEQETVARSVVATGERGYQIHRRHRYPGTHPVARGRFFALTVPRRHAHELKFAVQTEQSRA